MFKGLDYLKNCYCENCENQSHCKECGVEANYKLVKTKLQTKSKKEQAWDIAVKKNVDIHWIKKCKTLGEYNDMLNSWELGLTEEEFNILKENVNENN